MIKNKHIIEELQTANEHLTEKLRRVDDNQKLKLNIETFYEELETIKGIFMSQISSQSAT